MRYRRLNLLLATLAAAILLGACATKTPVARAGKLPDGSGGYYKVGTPYEVAGKRYHPMQSAAGYSESGTASWYGRDFHGKKTANGERYDMYAMSAAHKTLPMPTMVRVTNLENGRSVVVRVNDRGPFVKNRLIDLSYAAARELGYTEQGTARVRVEALEGAGQTTVAAARPAPQPRPVAVPVAAHAGDMYIQLGAFSLQQNADRLRNELAASYPTTRVYSDYRLTPAIHRVRIGPYADVRKIEQLVLSLQQQGYRQAIVVIE